MSRLNVSSCEYFLCQMMYYIVFFYIAFYWNHTSDVDFCPCRRIYDFHICALSNSKNYIKMKSSKVQNVHFMFKSFVKCLHVIRVWVCSYSCLFCFTFFLKRNSFERQLVNNISYKKYVFQNRDFLTNQRPVIKMKKIYSIRSGFSTDKYWLQEIVNSAVRTINWCMVT